MPIQVGLWKCGFMCADCMKGTKCVSACLMRKIGGSVDFFAYTDVVQSQCVWRGYG